jgi:hypothetical protein
LNLIRVNRDSPCWRLNFRASTDQKFRSGSLNAPKHEGCR